MKVLPLLKPNAMGGWRFLLEIEVLKATEGVSINTMHNTSTLKYIIISPWYNLTIKFYTANKRGIESEKL